MGRCVNKIVEVKLKHKVRRKCMCYVGLQERKERKTQVRYGTNGRYVLTAEAALSGAMVFGSQ